MGIYDRVCVRLTWRSGAKPLLAKAWRHAAVPSEVISGLLKKGPVLRLRALFPRRVLALLQLTAFRLVRFLHQGSDLINFLCEWVDHFDHQ